MARKLIIETGTCHHLLISPHLLLTIQNEDQQLGPGPPHCSALDEPKKRKGQTLSVCELTQARLGKAFAESNPAPATRKTKVTATLCSSLASPALGPLQTPVIPHVDYESWAIRRHFLGNGQQRGFGFCLFGVFLIAISFLLWETEEFSAVRASFCWLIGTF